MRGLGRRWALPIAVALSACGGDGDDPSSASGAATGAAGAGPGSAASGAGASSGTGGAAAGGWETRASLGGPRQEDAVVALEGKVYVIGGFDGAAAMLSTVLVYDPSADTWSSAPSLPAVMHHANAAVVGGTLYVLGSLRGGFAADGSAFAYTPGDAGWSPRAPMPAGTERGSSAVGVIGRKVYLAGGFRGGSVADVSAYDTGSDTWEALPPLPEARDHLAGGALGGILYAIGGRNGGIGELRAAVDAFDPASGVWSPRAPMLTPRGGAAAAVLGDRIFVVGGEGNPATATGVFEENESYDPAADAWTAHAPMITPRHGTGAAAVGATFHVPGGATVEAFGAVDTHEAFTP